MSKVWIQTLYQYNAWANQRILEMAAQLSPEQLKRRVEASFESIHDSLIHAMGAQWIWLSRWQGEQPTTILGSADFADLAAIKAYSPSWSW